MKIAVMVVGVISVAVVTFEFLGRIVAKHERTRFDKLSTEEQRKQQEQMYKRQQLA